MVAIKGTITRVEQGTIEVNRQELKEILLENFTAKDLTFLAAKLWLQSKGLQQDSILKLKSGKTDEYVWQTYENNGSHYSGYFDVKKEVEPQDVNIFDAFETLFDKLN